MGKEKRKKKNEIRKANEWVTHKCLGKQTVLKVQM